ncbi:hypothetical protein FQZ97_1099780 [compost metagenome]
MTLYDQIIHNNKKQWIAEGMEKGMQKGMQKTVLNAYDAGIDVATIRIITGEDEEKIHRILVQNKRIR